MFLRRWSADKNVRVKQRVSTFEAAVKAADKLLTDKDLYLWYQHPGDTVKGEVENLHKFRDNIAKGLEKQSNIAVKNSEFLKGALGPLTPVANGSPVQVRRLNKNNKFVTRMEIDGVFLNTKVVVMNEARLAPSESRVEKLVSRREQFEGLLNAMHKSPEKFDTVPEGAKDELLGSKLTDVTVVLSGYEVSPHVVAECEAWDIFVCMPNGEGYAVA